MTGIEEKYRRKIIFRLCFLRNKGTKNFEKMTAMAIQFMTIPDSLNKHRQSSEYQTAKMKSITKQQNTHPSVCACGDRTLKAKDLSAEDP